MESSNNPNGLETAQSDPVSYFNHLKPELFAKLFSASAGSEMADIALEVSVTSLLIFIIENFTGPSVSQSLDAAIMSALKSQIPQNFIDDLNFDGEIIHQKAALCEFLWIPLYLLRKFNNSPKWLSRTSIIAQQCLSGPSQTLLDILSKNAEGIEKVIFLLIFHRFNDFFAELDTFRKSIAFEFELTGIMGKKTKFQQDSKAQLSIHVANSESIRSSTVEKVKTDTPTSREVLLDEDTHLLERPKLDDANEIPTLSDIELCVLLLEAHAITEKNPEETIREERRLPLISSVLQCSHSYPITTCALFEKSRAEKREHNRQQRSVMQLESIIDDFSKIEPKPCERLRAFFSLLHPPMWEVRKELGLQMLYVGAARSAAKIFVEHKMWDELGLCCQISQDPSMGIEVLEGAEETPLTCAVLGELKGDKALLEKSWEISKHRYSRAKRSEAKIDLKKENWSEAAAEFEVALSLNHLYTDAWFSLGCCYMRMEQFEKAISALQNVVSLKGDDGESFSNLASCFTAIGKNAEAHGAIQQAIKYDRENFKIWENFIAISLNAKIVNDATFAIEELNRIVPKWCKVPLIYDVIQSVTSEKGDIQRLINALDAVAQSAEPSFDFWSIFGDLIETYGKAEDAVEMRTNAIKALEKDGKVTEQDQFTRLVDCASKLKATSDKVPDKKKAADQRIRVMIKKYEDDFASTEAYAKLKSLAESQ